MTALVPVKKSLPEESSYCELIEELGSIKCPLCKQDRCDIWMRGYGYDMEEKEIHDILLCRDCAMQLVRKISEDMCEFTKGGRYG